MSQQGKFLVPEVVWAKIRGYPWWPGLLSNVKQDKGGVLFKVDFFGDTTHAMLPLDKIAKFEEHYTTNEAMGRGSKRLAKAVEMAEKYLEDKGIRLNLTKKPGKNGRKSHSLLGNHNSEEIMSSEPQHKVA